jgi:hypothetical protein
MSTEPLASMASEFSQFYVSSPELAATGERVAAISVPFDATLTRVLTSTVELSLSSGLVPANLHDLMRAVLCDGAAMAELQRTRNLMPKTSGQVG